MALTMLDPNTALVVVDLQKGLTGLPVIHPMGDIVGRARALADAFRERGLPVVLVNVAGGAPGRTEQPRLALPRSEGWTDLIPELNRQAERHRRDQTDLGRVRQHRSRGAAEGRGVTQVVIAGVATGTGVESTARQAYEQGFNVTLALDAMTDLRPEAHDYSIRNVFPRLGETGTSQQIIDLLPTRSA